MEIIAPQWNQPSFNVFFIERYFILQQEEIAS